MGVDFSIRKANLSDSQALTDLCMKSKQSNGYDDDFMRQCADELRIQPAWIEKDDFWLAETAQGSLVGCIRLSASEDGNGELETCFVDPDWHGKGIGRTLFDHLLARATALELVLVGVDSDPAAETFYARMGFRTIGKVASGSIAGRTLPRMEMVLENKASGASKMTAETGV
ncbi:GNAT family N-acetyltransferase [Roseibium album]|uniref:GNAT family N-acetyltransferase n=1 Tax=Roseibium album TaxID=311410 RepID=UPI002491E8AF|nr:GNAT family N-acetyltransferase [Roseibium album]